MSAPGSVGDRVQACRDMRVDERTGEITEKHSYSAGLIVVTGGGMV